MNKVLIVFGLCLIAKGIYDYLESTYLWGWNVLRNSEKFKVMVEILIGLVSILFVVRG